jgi:hypothetical protein
MRVDGNTVHKCIHEALDYSWCDCSDETREDLQVNLPKPDEVQWCESCDDGIAAFTLSVTDSLSMDNLSYCCFECAESVMTDWMIGTDYSEAEGWEIKKYVR